MIMDKEYWENYYSKNFEPFAPSNFAKYVLNKLEEEASLIDIGCGNGRDTIFFSSNRITTLGVDQSENIIKNLKKHENKSLKFKTSDIKNLKDTPFEYAYCRFLFHSINEEEEIILLNWLKKNIIKKIFIEARSDMDIDKYDKTDHYRRLMNISKFRQLLSEINLTVEEEQISNKFSIYNKIYNVSDVNFDPTLIRLVLKS